MTKAWDKSDLGWLNFNANNWQRVQDGKWSWWKCEPYFYRREGELFRAEPKWHLLTGVEAVGEHDDAKYTAACGYSHTFKRIFLEKPRSVIRKPALAVLCTTCSHGKL